MEGARGRLRNRVWGYALAVATVLGLIVLFLPWIACPSCAGEGKHVWNQRDYPCLVCDGACRISG